MFVTKEDHESDSRYDPPADDEPRGLILPNGDINWHCPCIGGTASGPCGYEFREAFSCFHYSKSETKGSECAEKFSALNNCMSEFPALYSRREEDEELKQQTYDRDKLDAELLELEQRELALEKSTESPEPQSSKSE
jgi:intermembrane space import and assembly protein 40